jgi:hypothetical protein
MYTKFLSESLKRPLGGHRRIWEDIIGLTGSRVGTCGLDASGSGQGSAVGSCEHGNELSGSIKGREFLD